MRGLDAARPRTKTGRLQQAEGSLFCLARKPRAGGRKGVAGDTEVIGSVLIAALGGYRAGQGAGPGTRQDQSGATVLGRLKEWLLGVLAMLTLQGALRVAPRACGAAA